VLREWLAARAGAWSRGGGSKAWIPARAASLCQRRRRRTTQAPAPKSASPDGGAHASRYRDREHVNK